MFAPPIVIAAVLTLAPFVAAAFFASQFSRLRQVMPASLRVILPSLLCVPYVLVARWGGVFGWDWLLLYALLPVAVAVLLEHARRVDPERRGTWRDFLVLGALGLAVDLRWFEPAWPARMAVFNKILLLDAGMYGFLALRQLDGVGFDLRLRARDLAIGLREFVYYVPVALPLGLALRFLHLHSLLPTAFQALGAFILTFFFIAVPEELFFRGWMQNLLERRLGRYPSLFVTAILFGLSHFNKRALHFNWRYVLLAALAGIFYGRAWRADRRVGASALTHTCVDTVWSLWLR